MGDAGFEQVHVPVLCEEVLRALDLKSGDTIVDCTVGAGGHAERILQRIAPDGLLLGIDRDAEALKAAQERLRSFAGRYRLVQGNFRNLDEIMQRENVDRVDGVLMDLGTSSMQIDNPERGFSFQGNGPLDMRMDPSQRLTAEEIVNRWPQESLEKIFRQYGEVQNARALAKKIVHARMQVPLKDTFSLVQVIATTGGARRRKIHPATQVFQALRIAVNDEMGALEEALPKALAGLKVNGRLCVISFHSLEDRMVKRFFQSGSAKCSCPPGSPVCRCGGKAILKCIVRKPVRPTAAEVQSNPRSRSARMRVAEKINEVASPRPNTTGARNDFKTTRRATHGLEPS